MAASFKITFTLTKATFAEAYTMLFNQRVKPNHVRIMAVLVLAICFANIYYNGFKMEGIWLYAILLPLPLVYWTSAYYLPKRWAEATFKKQGEKTYTWIISDAHLEIIDNNRKATLPWQHFEKAILGENILLLVSTKKAITPVPLSAFGPGQLEQLQGLVAKQ